MPTAAKPLIAHVRWCVRMDVPAMLAIDRASFEEPWDEAKFVHYLRQRDCVVVVAEVGDAVVGFLAYRLCKKHLEFLRFAVHPDYCRRGVGSQMVGKLKKKLSSHRRRWIAVDLHEEALAFQLFFKAQGFVAKPVEGAYRFTFAPPLDDLMED